MYWKIIGTLLIVTGCGGLGISMAASHRAETKSLRKLIALLDYMECELQYRLTPLPQLCRQAAGESSGKLKDLFLRFSQEMEDQISPDISCCMHGALRHIGELPTQTKDCLIQLGHSLGRFDLEGQLKGLEAIRSLCRGKLDTLESNQENRLRSYQTLSLCAGAALAILLI